MENDKHAEINQILMQFGPLHGNVEKQEIHTVPQETPVSPVAVETYASPVHLSSRKGSRIDLIRALNALYELGLFVDQTGGRITKKEFFTAAGRFVNIDLENYDKDLSYAKSACISIEKQTKIFDEMKEKHIEISKY